MGVQWGILGTGRIAGAFAEGLAGSATGRLVAVGSRALPSAEAFAASHGGRAHGSYQDLLADPEVEAVYISLPNHLHAPWTIRCAEAGKHVLCEKPFALNAGQALEAIEACRVAGVFFMEAFMYRCHPQTELLRSLVADGAVGEVRVVQATFGFDAGDRADDIRWVNAWGGGGIMDVGCYTASMAGLLAGAPAVAVGGAAHLDPDSRVDRWATASVRYANGVTAALTCATHAELGGEVRVFGSRGGIVVPSPWFAHQGGSVVRLRTNGEARELAAPSPLGLYSLEADAVARAVERGDREAPEMPWRDTVENLRTLDAWREAVGLVFDGEGPPLVGRIPAGRIPATTGAPAGAPAAAETPAAPATIAPAAATGAAATASPAMPQVTVDGLDKPLSRLVLGTVALLPGRLRLASELLDGFVEAGGTTIDTARHYGTEPVVGLWLRLRGVRDDLVVIGKGCHPRPDGAPRVTPDDLAADLAESLDTMGLDRFDLFLLHRDDPSVPVGELVDALNRHADAGQVGAFGASNWSAGRIAEANAYAAANGLRGFVASSTNLSLAVPAEPVWPGTVSVRADPEELAWHRREGFPLLAWSAQSRGYFTDRAPDLVDDEEGQRIWHVEANAERRRRAATLGERLGATANQVALAWVLHQPFPTVALIGPETPAEAAESYGALRLRLDPDKAAWLDLGAQPR